jgi:hypothetical protein
MTQEEYTFSICTLVKNKQKYGIFIESLKRNDFLDSENEIITIDNSFENSHDCYSAIKNFINNSKNRYIILSHDDVIVNNCKQALIDELKRIHLIDESAVVFGVAGIYKNPLKGVGHFFSKRGEKYWGFDYNGRVSTLDECFIIIKKSSGVSVSDNLNGFHFYGADMCLNASKKGFSCYAIDFPITHKSPGNLDESFLIAREKFLSHLNKSGNCHVISTTCTTLYAGNNFFLKSLSQALSIIKPIIGKNPKSNYIKNKILNDPSNNYFDKISIYLLYNALMIYCKSTFMKRVYGDFNWWKKNWRSRIPVIMKR